MASLDPPRGILIEQAPALSTLHLGFVFHRSLNNGSILKSTLFRNSASLSPDATAFSWGDSRAIVLFKVLYLVFVPCSYSLRRPPLSCRYISSCFQCRSFLRCRSTLLGGLLLGMSQYLGQLFWNKKQNRRSPLVDGLKFLALFLAEQTRKSSK